MEGGWREFGVTTALLSLGLGPLAANPPSRQGLGLVQLESDLTDLCDVKNKSTAEETPFLRRAACGLFSCSFLMI